MPGGQKSLLKVVVLGDAGVGKTSIVKQYVEHKFDDEYKPTIGADFLTKEVDIKERGKITLQIWDTAGQERFKSMAVSFYRGADACVLCYDITDPRSFHNLEMWMQEFVDHAGTGDPIDKEKFPFIVLGNKADKEADRQIGKPRAEAWCKGKNNIPLFETSAVSKLNLDKAFDLVAQAAGRGEAIPSVALSNVNDIDKKEAEEDEDEEADPGDEEEEKSKAKPKSKIKRADPGKKGRRTSSQVPSPRHAKKASRRNAPLPASSSDDSDPTDSDDTRGGRGRGGKDRPSRRASPNDDDYRSDGGHSRASGRGRKGRGGRGTSRRSVSPDGTIHLDDRYSNFSGSSEMESQNCCGVQF